MGATSTGGRRRSVCLVVAVVLLPLVAIVGVPLFGSRLDWRLHPGARNLAQLRPTTIELLRKLDAPIELTLFVSAERELPLERRGIEAGAMEVLAAMRRAVPDRVEYRVLDPGLDPEHGPAYASRLGVSPIAVGKVVADAARQGTIWAALAIRHGRQRESLIQDLRASDVAHLEDLIVAHLGGAQEVRRPVIGVAAPQAGYAGLQAVIEQAGASMVEVAFERDAKLPESIDLLLWIEPAMGRPEQIEALRRHLATGRSAVIAGHPLQVSAAGGSPPTWQVAAAACDWDELLRPFGLGVQRVLLADRQREPAAGSPPVGGTPPIANSFRFRVPPAQTDTRSLRVPPTGALIVDRVSPLEVDPARIVAAGYRPTVVATTSEHTQIVPNLGRVTAAEVLAGERSPKQPWLVHLQPADPWHGQLAIATSAALFQAASPVAGSNPNAAFAGNLLRAFTDESKLARIRVPRQALQTLPELSAAKRLGWRFVTVLLLPLLLLLLVLRRAAAGQTSQTSHAGRAHRRRLAVATVPILLVFALFGAGSGLAGSFAGPRLDLSVDGANTPGRVTQQLIAEHRDRLEVEVWISDPTRLPLAMKSVEPQLLAELRALGLRRRLGRPEELDAERREELVAAGLRPFRVERVEDDAKATVQVHSGLRLRSGERSVVIPEIDAKTLPHLSFLLSAALRRLESGRAPRVGVLSDLPRLSPAEAHVDYQEKGYTAPVGADVYSRVKRLLARHGYEVVYVNPDEVVVPKDLDLLVWLQPRYLQRSIAQVSAYVAGGGRALIAVQHYNIQQRQYRGAGFETVYWPQPQFHGLNDWLELFGVRQIGEKRGELAGEILYDRNHAQLVLDTQVNRSAIREHDPQAVARPFLIRAFGAGLSRDSVITRGLGELLFVWGSRFTLDPAVMAASQVTAQTLVTTSPHWWTYAWSGRWLPHDSFVEPQDSQQMQQTPQPLAVLLDGRFPAVEPFATEDGRRGLRPVASGAAGAPGQLLLIGCSEMFKDHYLHHERYQHDQLLLNAVAQLALGPQLAEIQARRREPERLPVLPASERLASRAMAIGAAPVLLGALALLVAWLRRRPLLTRPM